MAVAAAQKWINLYKLRRSTDRGWQQGQLVHVVGATPAALVDFEQNHFGRPERFSGVVDYPDEVAVLDLSPAMDFTTPAVVDLTQADVRQRLGLSDDQIARAIGELRMPPGRVQYDTAGVLGPTVAARRVWRSNELDRWVEIVNAIFPRALPGSSRR